MTALLSVENAHVRLSGADRPTLDGASLSVSCGEIAALLGPSGAGKTTLLRAVAGLEPLDAGAIRFGAETWSGEGVHRPVELRRCGFVFQDYALFPHLTALQNVMFGLREGPKSHRRAAALGQLDAMHLSGRAHAYPHELSGGEQQRVALARALAPGPAVMLLDEPFSGLDRGLRSGVRADTASALRASGAAALIVTHDAEEAMALADHVALMVEGRVIQTGAPDTLYLRPNCLAAARLMGDVEVFDSRVSAGLAQTPIGAVSTALANGAACHVLVRPEGVRIGKTGAPAEVTARRVASGLVRLELRLSEGAEAGRMIEARASLADPLRPGDRTHLSLDADFVSVTER